MNQVWTDSVRAARAAHSPMTTTATTSVSATPRSNSPSGTNCHQGTPVSDRSTKPSRSGASQTSAAPPSHRVHPANRPQQGSSRHARPSASAAAGRQAEEGDEAGVPVQVAGRRRPDRPVDLLEGDDDQARGPRRQQHGRRTAPPHEPGAQQRRQHRARTGRHGQHPGVEGRLPGTEGVLAQRAAQRRHLGREDVQCEHRHDSGPDQQHAQHRRTAGGPRRGGGMRGHGRLLGVDPSTDGRRRGFPEGRLPRPRPLDVPEPAVGDA
jgi:hypothetical protein